MLATQLQNHYYFQYMYNNCRSTNICLLSCYSTHSWSASSHVLLQLCHLVPLSVRRSVSKLTFLYKCVCNLTFVRNDILLHRVSGSRRLHDLQLICPFAIVLILLKVLIFVLLLLFGMPYKITRSVVIIKVCCLFIECSRSIHQFFAVDTLAQ